MQTSENLNIIQKPTHQQNVEDIYNVNFKTEYVVFLLECFLCNLEYIGKNETPLNFRLNNRRKELKDPKEMLAHKHFQKSGHKFNEHARFTIIDRLTKTKLDKEILKESLIQRENFSKN